MNTTNRPTSSTAKVVVLSGAALFGSATAIQAACGYGISSSVLTYSAPDSSKSVTAKFFRLRDQWKAETALSSSFSTMVLNPGYQRIIAMGHAAIPLMLSELQSDPDHWFWALEAITGENPIPEGAAGDLEKMTSAWIVWGQARGYLS